MPFESLPGVNLQLRSYNFPALPPVIPVNKAAIIKAIADPLLNLAQYYSPEERQKRELERATLQYRADLLKRQSQFLSNSANNSYDAEGIPAYKPDGTPYSYQEKLQMRNTLDIMRHRDKQPDQRIDVNASYFSVQPQVPEIQTPASPSIFP